MSRAAAMSLVQKGGRALRAAHPGASRPAGALRAPMRGTECRAHLGNRSGRGYGSGVAASGEGDETGDRGDRGGERVRETGDPQGAGPEAVLRVGHGIEGDAHAGAWHRQVEPAFACRASRRCARRGWSWRPATSPRTSRSRGSTSGRCRWGLVCWSGTRSSWRSRRSARSATSAATSAGRSGTA